LFIFLLKQLFCFKNSWRNQHKLAGWNPWSLISISHTEETQFFRCQLWRRSKTKSPAIQFWWAYVHYLEQFNLDGELFFPNLKSIILKVIFFVHINRETSVRWCLLLILQCLQKMIHPLNSFGNVMEWFISHTPKPSPYCRIHRGKCRRWWNCLMRMSSGNRVPKFSINSENFNFRFNHECQGKLYLGGNYVVHYG
jgi:hypothetical protein